MPMGMTIRDVVYKVGGGILNDKPFKAVQLGGPSGGCLPNELIDTSIEYETIGENWCYYGVWWDGYHGQYILHGRYRKFFLTFPHKKESWWGIGPFLVGIREPKRFA